MSNIAEGARYIEKWAIFADWKAWKKKKVKKSTKKPKTRNSLNLTSFSGGLSKSNMRTWKHENPTGLHVFPYFLVLANFHVFMFECRIQIFRMSILRRFFCPWYASVVACTTLQMCVWPWYFPCHKLTRGKLKMNAMIQRLAYNINIFDCATHNLLIIVKQVLIGCILIKLWLSKDRKHEKWCLSANTHCRANI